MKEHLDNKEMTHHITAKVHNPSHAYLTPAVALILTGIIGFLTFALFSSIPIADYYSNSMWHLFG